MASWYTDNSDEFTVNGNVVTCMSGRVSAFNAMWRDGDGVSSGRHYWRINLQALEGGAGVGITSKEHFRKGDFCHSIMYSGDLINGGINGSRCLVAQYGPKPEENDFIGILAVFEGVNLKVYFDINGKSLGLAFDVPASTFIAISPMVSFFFSGSAVCVKETTIPDITVRAPDVFTGFEGEWKLTSFDDTDVTVGYAPRAKFVFVEAGKYEWYVDRLRTTLNFVNGMWKSDAVISPGKTRNPERREEEKAVRTLMAEVRMIEVRNNGQLSVRSETNSSIWNRIVTVPEPFVGQPFEVNRSNEQL